MTLPKDPAMLKSVLNTLLRDEYETLGSLCEDRELSLEELLETLAAAGLRYDEKTNRVL